MSGICTHQSGAMQCPYPAVPGSSRCEAHGGDDAEDKRQYRLSQERFKTRQKEVGDHGALLSLRDEITLVKLLLEDRFNLIDPECEASRLNAVDPINKLALTLDRLIRSCNELERNIGSVLSKDALRHLARDVVGILLEELRGVPNHEEIIDVVSVRLTDTIDQARNLPAP